MADETKTDKAKEEKVIVVAKRPADVQRMKLEKLMKNPVYELCIFTFLLSEQLTKRNTIICNNSVLSLNIQD